ncbi:response regulator [Pedobacter sp. SYSU D00535]|uniref:response regulator n=1 Tax=Pedobacter sp. SYSU D00535 TaxID=2810308 RepID=UPI001A967D41|nr:response regulator [Pedobacter sp. SYSU D00535]
MKKVYLIEENEAIADVLVSILEEHYKIEVKKNVAEIAKQASTFQPDLLIIDHYTNNSDLCKTVNEIKNVQQLKNIPLILCSNQNTIKEVSADAYLTKPFDLTDFTTIVKNTIQE